MSKTTSWCNNDVLITYQKTLWCINGVLISYLRIHWQVLGRSSAIPTRVSSGYSKSSHLKAEVEILVYTPHISILPMKALAKRFQENTSRNFIWLETWENSAMAPGCSLSKVWPSAATCLPLTETQHNHQCQLVAITRTAVSRATRVAAGLTARNFLIFAANISFFFQCSSRS